MVVIIWALGVIGWIINIINVVQTIHVVNGLFILRCVGILFGPLGSVLGWLTVFHIT